MKKILFIAMIAAAAFSCKKNVYSPSQPEEGAEISIASNTVTKAQVVDYEKDTRNDFFENDQIGIFLANLTGAVTNPFAFNETESSAVLGTTHRFNVGYNYALPYWKAIDPATRLKFPIIGDKVAKLYAYFPYAETDAPADTTNASYIKVEKAIATGDEGKATITYTLPQYQNTNAILRAADLMYAKSEGDGDELGWAITSKGVKLAFTHQLTKVVFKVAISNAAKTDAATTRFIRAIEVNGKNIFVGNANMKIENGELTLPATTGVVMFRGVGLNEGVEITTLADGKRNPADFATYDDTKRVDMLLYPFASQVANENEIAIYLSNDNTEIGAGPDKGNLAKAIEEGTVERYISSIPAPTTTEWKFAAGAANVMNVSIDVATKAINIKSTITPWSGNVQHDIVAE